MSRCPSHDDDEVCGDCEPTLRGALPNPERRSTREEAKAHLAELRDRLTKRNP